MAVIVSAAPAFGHGSAPLAGDVTVEIVSDNGSVFQSFPASDRRKNETRLIKKYLGARGLLQRPNLCRFVSHGRDRRRCHRQKDRPEALLDMSRKKFAPAAPSMNSPSGSQGKARAEESAGTGFGDSRYSPVVRVEFEPESVPVQKTLVKYEWRETLCKKGIIDCCQERKNRLWDSEGYAPYLPGYPRS